MAKFFKICCCCLVAFVLCFALNSCVSRLFARSQSSIIEVSANNDQPVNTEKTLYAFQLNNRIELYNGLGSFPVGSLLTYYSLSFYFSCQDEIFVGYTETFPLSVNFDVCYEGSGLDYSPFMVVDSDSFYFPAISSPSSLGSSGGITIYKYLTTVEKSTLDTCYNNLIVGQGSSDTLQMILTPLQFGSVSTVTSYRFNLAINPFLGYYEIPSEPDDGSYQEGYDDGYNQGIQEGQGLVGSQIYQNGYDKGYTDGYNQGEDDGQLSGRQEGYNQGLTEGISQGYLEGYQATENALNAARDEGFEQGLTQGLNTKFEDISPFRIVADSVNRFLDIELFGSMKISTLLYISFGLILLGVLMKVFLGG